jgi:3-oxoacyl-[acyl-carrier protein] reductase
MGALVGKRALITGAASGFGAGIAARFVAEGASVIIADINHNGARNQADSLGEAASWIEMDVSSDRSVADAAAAISEPLDILVNNAGIGHRPQPLTELTEADFDRLFAVNMKSVFLTARHLLPIMTNSSGAILNIASTAGVSPRPGLTWYNASKGWVITATRSMAVELAASGIRVNALNPVAGETPLLATFLGEDTPERRAEFLATIPLGRFSTPADLGATACYLCSDDASMITGVTLEVDGGRCI